MNSSESAASGGSVPVSELRVGDLVFFEAVEGEPLSGMIKEYDGGPFSHVGVMFDQTQVASSRGQNFSIDDIDDADFGGVRLNELIQLKERKPQVGRPKNPQDIDPAHTLITSFLETSKDRKDSKSNFSFVKLFLVASGLDGLRQRNPDATEAILHTVLKAADIWDYGEMASRGQHPEFFCSEVVTVAYSKSFTYGDFRRIAPTFEAEGWLPGWPSAITSLRFVKRLLDYLRTIGGDQEEAVVQLLFLLCELDPGFLKEAAKQLKEYLKEKKKNPPSMAGLRLPDDNDPLPSSLVTPRMLANASWIELPLRSINFG